MNHTIKSKSKERFSMFGVRKIKGDNIQSPRNEINGGEGLLNKRESQMFSKKQSTTSQIAISNKA